MTIKAISKVESSFRWLILIVSTIIIPWYITPVNGQRSFELCNEGQWQHRTWDNIGNTGKASTCEPPGHSYLGVGENHPQVSHEPIKPDDASHEAGDKHGYDEIELGQPQ